MFLNQKYQIFYICFAAYYTHNFIEMWNTIFPNDIITAADLKQTLSVVNCLLLILKRLDIDPDVLVKVSY